MEITNNSTLGEIKLFVKSLLKKSAITELNELMQYHEETDKIELAMRCICIDKDIDQLKEGQREVSYNINNIDCLLETEDEIRTFWSALHPLDLLVFAYINQTHQR